MEKLEKFCKISKILQFFFSNFKFFFQILNFFQILKFFSNFEFFLKFWKNLKSLKFFEIFDNFFQNFEWITRLVQLASLAGRSGLLGTWGLLLLAHFPRPPPLGAYVKTFRHLHLWPQKPFPTSAPTFEDFERLERGGMGQRGKSLLWRVEFSGSLTHLLGTS